MCWRSVGDRAVDIVPLTADDFDATHTWAGNLANTRYMAQGSNNEDNNEQ